MEDLLHFANFRSQSQMSELVRPFVVHAYIRNSGRSVLLFMLFMLYTEFRNEKKILIDKAFFRLSLPRALLSVVLIGISICLSNS